ncbi:hypothetical protein GCM10010360_50800 [Streptomyces nogalater]
MLSCPLLLTVISHARLGIFVFGEDDARLGPVKTPEEARYGPEPDQRVVIPRARFMAKSVGTNPGDREKRRPAGRRRGQGAPGKFSRRAGPTEQSVLVGRKGAV